jgi:chromosome segregation ATPase
MTNSNLAKQLAKQAIRKAQGSPAAKKAPSETAKKITELKKLETRDKTHIIILQNRVKELKEELDKKNRERKKEDEINEERIDTLTTELDTLKRIIKEKGVELETPSEKRIEKIEKVAKAKTAYMEITKLEDKLEKMEKKYENLKAQRKFSEDGLEVIKLSIEKLREMIEVKKFDLEKEKDLESAPKPFVRHTIKFEAPAPRKSIPAEEEIKLPPLPEEMPEKPSLKEPEMPELPPGFKKPKRTFWQKLLGKR